MRALIIVALALVAAADRPHDPPYTPPTTHKPSTSYSLPQTYDPKYKYTTSTDRPYKPSTTHKPTYSHYSSTNRPYKPPPTYEPTYSQYSTTQRPYKPSSTYKPKYPATYGSGSTYKAKPIAILDQENVHPGDGTYQFHFSTENGIYRSESGMPKPGYGKDAYGQPKAGYRQEGSWRYTDEYGNPIEVTFVADEYGYQPSSAILPKPVPTEYPNPEVNPNYVDTYTTEHPPYKPLGNPSYGEPYST